MVIRRKEAGLKQEKGGTVGVKQKMEGRCEAEEEW